MNKLGDKAAHRFNAKLAAGAGPRPDEGMHVIDRQGIRTSSHEPLQVTEHSSPIIVSMLNIEKHILSVVVIYTSCGYAKRCILMRTNTKYF
jgi:hypothetical protein